MIMVCHSAIYMMILGALFMIAVQHASAGQGVYRGRGPIEATPLGNVTQLLSAKSPFARMAALRLMWRSHLLLLENTPEAQIAREVIAVASGSDSVEQVRSEAQALSAMLSHSAIQIQGRAQNDAAQAVLGLLADEEAATLRSSLAFEEGAPTADAIYEVLFEDARLKFQRIHASDGFVDSAAFVLRLAHARGDFAKFGPMVGELVDALRDRPFQNDLVLTIKARNAVQIAVAAELKDVRVLDAIRVRLHSTDKGRVYLHRGDALLLLTALNALDPLSTPSLLIFSRFAEKKGKMTFFESTNQGGWSWGSAPAGPIAEISTAALYAAAPLPPEVLAAIQDPTLREDLSRANGKRRGWIGRFWDACGRALGGEL